MRNIAISLSIVLLAACGGGAPDVPETASVVQPAAPSIITEQSSAQAGDERIGATVLVLPLPGPVLQLERPALVRVQISGQLLQSAHYGATAAVSLSLQEPIATTGSSLPATIAPQSAVAVPLVNQLWLQLPAGSHPLVARITVRALDANATPTSALARAEADVTWTLEIQQ